MDRSTAARIGIAGVLAGAGLAAGGVAMASAESTNQGATASSDAHPGGPRGHRGPEAAALAKELGLSQAKVKAALDAVREDLRPDKPSSADGTRPAPPTEAQRAAHQAALAKALSAKLGVSESKVAAALEVVEKQEEADRTQQRAESRADLVTRLDAAVKAGTLTEADKTSVLKAYDADLIGGGPGGGPRGHGAPPAAATS